MKRKIRRALVDITVPITVSAAAIAALQGLLGGGCMMTGVM